MLIQLNENGVPFGNAVTESNFRNLHPRVSFPSYLTPDDVESFGFGIYEFTQQPGAGRYEIIEEGAPVKGDDGIWRQNWVAKPMNDVEKQQADAMQARMVRQARTASLFETDWTQMADSPVNGAGWVAYRQALRDITSQSGFPWDVAWPEEPA